MNDNYNYPIGADNKYAPWNNEDKKPKEVEVTASITLSKTFKINVTDYKVLDTYKDEEGNIIKDIDYSECDLKTAIQEQVYLPNEAGYLFKICLDEKQLPTLDKVEDLSNWNIDDFEVILE